MGLSSGLFGSGCRRVDAPAHPSTRRPGYHPHVSGRGGRAWHHGAGRPQRWGWRTRCGRPPTACGRPHRARGQRRTADIAPSPREHRRCARKGRDSQRNRVGKHRRREFTDDLVTKGAYVGTRPDERCLHHVHAQVGRPQLLHEPSGERGLARPGGAPRPQPAGSFRAQRMDGVDLVQRAVLGPAAVSLRVEPHGPTALAASGVHQGSGPVRSRVQA